MVEGDKDAHKSEQKKTQAQTGIEPWDEARTAPMRELAKGTKGDPFELVKNKKKRD
jgi:hypothetical protein